MRRPIPSLQALLFLGLAGCYGTPHVRVPSDGGAESNPSADAVSEASAEAGDGRSDSVDSPADGPLEHFGEDAGEGGSDSVDSSMDAPQEHSSDGGSDSVDSSMDAPQEHSSDGGDAGPDASGPPMDAASEGGSCGISCGPTQTCVDGRCLLNDAQPCLSGAQCASGRCNPFYVDQDSDGYGTGTATGFCTITVAPVGYASVSGDCCDTATNLAVAKLIHPGADYQTTTAGGVCNITWDFDCSGAVEKNVDSNTCSAFPQCAVIAGQYPDSQCGNAVAGCGCGAGTGGVVHAVLLGHDPGLSVAPR